MSQDEIRQRLDEQDEVLKKILAGMVEHRTYHQMTDPAVVELINLLKGAKGAKVVLTWITLFIAGAAATWDWIIEHVKLLK